MSLFFAELRKVWGGRVFPALLAILAAFNKCFTADILHESLVGEFLRGVNDCLPIVCLFHVIFKLLLIDIQFNFSRNKVFAFIVYCLCWIFAQSIQNFLDCHLNSSF